MSQGWSQDQQVVRHEFKEQKEPEGSASRPRQAENPRGSSQQLREKEPDSAKDRCQVRVWVSQRPTGAGR